MAKKKDPQIFETLKEGKTLTLAQLKAKTYILTDEVMQKLIGAFKYDFTWKEAVAEAGIAERTLAYWMKVCPEFAAEMDNAKTFLARHAKANIGKSIVKDGSITDSWQFLTRRQKDLYSEKVVTEDVTPDKLDTDTLKAMDKFLKTQNARNKKANRKVRGKRN